MSEHAADQSVHPAEHLAVNQAFWDKIAPLHAGSEYYNVQCFLDGNCTLGDVELDEVGSVQGPLALSTRNEDDRLVVTDSYFHQLHPRTVVSNGSYAVSDPGLGNDETREWTHSIGEVTSALIDAGLDIEFLHEFPGDENRGCLACSRFAAYGRTSRKPDSRGHRHRKRVW